MNEENRKQFNKRVKMRLIEYDMEVKDLAEKIGSTPRTVNRWLSGDRPPTVKGVISIAKVLNLSLDEMLIPA